MKHNGNNGSRSRKNGQAPNGSLGPVENLEHYLQPDWWRRIFNSMYLKTDADVVEDMQITHKEVDLFTEILGLEKNMVILDLARIAPVPQPFHEITIFSEAFAPQT